MGQTCLRREVFSSLVIAGLGLTLTACNTAKATTDTTANFFSSKSPASMFTADGRVLVSSGERA